MRDKESHDLSNMYVGGKKVGAFQSRDDHPEKLDEAETLSIAHNHNRTPSIESTGNEESEELFGGGSFDLSLRKDIGQLNEATDRRLGVMLHSTELSVLFYGVLGCPRADPYLSDDDIDVWTERRRLSFQNAIPDHPMIARMWNPFRNIWYAPDEVGLLKSECERIRAQTTNDLALEGLQKLVRACDDAMVAGLGLFLVSD